MMGVIRRCVIDLAPNHGVPSLFGYWPGSNKHQVMPQLVFRWSLPSGRRGSRSAESEPPPFDVLLFPLPRQSGQLCHCSLAISLCARMGGVVRCQCMAIGRWSVGRRRRLHGKLTRILWYGASCLIFAGVVSDVRPFGHCRSCLAVVVVGWRLGAFALGSDFRRCWLLCAFQASCDPRRFFGRWSALLGLRFSLCCGLQIAGASRMCVVAASFGFAGIGGLRMQHHPRTPTGLHGHADGVILDAPSATRTIIPRIGALSMMLPEFSWRRWWCIDSRFPLSACAVLLRF